MYSGFKKTVAAAALTSGLSIVSYAAEAGGYTYNTVGPESKATTYARGINNSSEVVGSYFNQTTPFYQGFTSNDVTHVYNNSLVYTGSNYGGTTSAYGVNDSGEIVGTFLDKQGNTEGFLDNGGHFTNLVDPASNLTSSTETVPTGINNSGEVVGYFNNTTGVNNYGIHGFLENGGNYVTLDDPSATIGSTYAYGINNSGEVAGYFFNATGAHGFVYDGKNYTTLDDPNANPGSTEAYGINDNGMIVGAFLDAKGVWHGFLFNGSQYLTINNGTGSGNTYLYGINNSGDMVGSYQSGSSQLGLEVIPNVPLPATFWLFGSVLAGFVGIKRRKSLVG